jgi:chromosomal replication initiation ATPase DnaA
VLVKFVLKDLDSRLKNIFAVEIKNPSQESIKQLLTNAFSRRQIKTSRQVVDFISDNIERSFDAVMNAVKMVEIYIQESGKNITVAEVKKFLKSQN